MRLSRPERKAIILFGPSTKEMAAFANLRGVALFDRTQLADAALDLGSYYALSVRAANCNGGRAEDCPPYRPAMARRSLTHFAFQTWLSSVCMFIRRDGTRNTSL